MDSPIKTQKLYELSGMDPCILFYKILSCIDNGVTTEQLRSNPLVYIVSGQTKEIVVNTGGEGLKVSYEIIEEMAKRGDLSAIKLLKKNDFFTIRPNGTNKHKWTYLEIDYAQYDRENPILIEILKEQKLDNIGGWELNIYTVYIERWSYKVIKSNDYFGSEYVEGYINLVC